MKIYYEELSFTTVEEIASYGLSSLVSKYLNIARVVFSNGAPVGALT